MARAANAKNIIVGAGTVYLGPAGSENTALVGTAQTAASSTFQNPANVGIATGASWYHAGYTTDGVTLSIEPDYGEVMVDQLLDVARIFKQGQKVTVGTSLAEGTLENLYVAMGAGKWDLHYSGAASFNSVFGDAVSSSAIGSASGIVASSAQTAGVLDLNGGALGQAPLERSICIVGNAPANFGGTAPTNGSERIYIGYRAVAMETVGISIKRDEATFFPVNFRLLASETNEGANGDPLYGKIVDRVW